MLCRGVGPGGRRDPAGCCGKLPPLPGGELGPMATVAGDLLQRLLSLEGGLRLPVLLLSLCPAAALAGDTEVWVACNFCAITP